MEKIKIGNDEYNIISINKCKNLLEIVFENEVTLVGQDLSTIELYTAGGVKCTDLKGYTTIYNGDGTDTIILSNDGSVYTVPEEPEPVKPYVPTLEEVESSKIAEMKSICEQNILAGFTSKAFDGVTELSYDCDAYSQLDLNGLVAIAQLRLINPSITETLKWKSSDQIECVEWTPEQILALGLDMKRHIEGNKDNYHALKIYISGLATIEEKLAVTWDTVIK